MSFIGNVNRSDIFTNGDAIMRYLKFYWNDGHAMKFFHKRTIYLSHHYHIYLPETE